MIPIETDVAVIGGGPAGIAAALTAARQDLAVTLIEAGSVGGESAMLAWRVLERTVDRHVAAGSAKRDAIWAEARAELKRLGALREERVRLRLADAGVDVLGGPARFVSAHEVAVAGGPSVHFDRAVIATGSRRLTLPGAAPDGERLVTPAMLLNLSELPEQVMVVGGGAAAAELVDSLSRIEDVEVSWMMDEFGMLPRFERELADALGDVLLGRAVRLVHDKPVRELGLESTQAKVIFDGGKSYDAPLVVLCLGHRTLGGVAPPENLGLAEVGLERIQVDEHLQTPTQHIWAAGDCTGRCQSASHAEAMGRLAARALAGVPVAPWDPSQIPLVVHTHPQLAQVGATPERLIGRDLLLYSARGEESLSGLLGGVGEGLDEKGFLRLVCDSATGEILGFSGAGPGAANAASAVTIALGLKATDEVLQNIHVDVFGDLDGLLSATR